MSDKPRVRLSIEALDMTGWAAVYKGGHHTIWCDGSNHMSADGGSVDIYAQRGEKHFVREEYRCDCAAWGNALRQIAKN